MTGSEQIHHERVRQITEKGYGAANDDAYIEGQLILAAIAYAHEAIPFNAPVEVKDGVMVERFEDDGSAPVWWPWGQSDWDPSDDSTRNLVVAGALIAAEIDRIRRAKS